MHRYAFSALNAVYNGIVDNRAEKLWITCGQTCGKPGSKKACGYLWRTARVFHRQAEVIPSSPNRANSAPVGLQALIPSFHRAYYYCSSGWKFLYFPSSPVRH